MYEEQLSQLSPQERELFRALQKEKYPRLAEMYLGAKLCWLDEANPERVHTTAHCLRELAEKIGFKVNHPAMGTVLREAMEKYEKFRKEWIFAFDLREFSPHTETAIQIFEDIGSYNEQYNKKRKERFTEVISQRRSINDASNTYIASEITNIWSFFTDVCHHGKTAVTEDLMEIYIAQLERLLLPLVKPQAATNINEMLRLIEEAEK